MTPPDRSQDPAERGRSDPYRDWDAAYVLGALSPTARREFEEHLAGCGDCRDAVSELAGMPGLLAQVSPDEVAELGLAAATASTAGIDSTMPETLRSPVLGRLARRRRVNRAMLALAAAFALLAGVLGIGVLRGSFVDPARPEGASFRVAFTRVVPSEMVAVADVVPVEGGTELNVECLYGEKDPKVPFTRSQYEIVVLDRQGQPTPVKTWPVQPNHLMTPSGKSTLPVSKIGSLEIRTKSGTPLLRADLR